MPTPTPLTRRYAKPTKDLEYIQDNLFKNPLTNFGLDTIIREWQIMTTKPLGLSLYPAIRIVQTGSTPIAWGYLEESGYTGAQFALGLELHIVMEKHSQFEYNGVTYKGVEETIPMLEDIMKYILLRNYEFFNDDETWGWRNLFFGTARLQENYENRSKSYALIIPITLDVEWKVSYEELGIYD